MTFSKNKITKANTVSWGNLLVTVFAAPYLDRIPNALITYSSTNLHHRNSIACLDKLSTAAPYFANTAPYPAAHRDPPAGGLTTGTINRWISPGNIPPPQAGSSLKTPVWVFYLRSALSTAVPLGFIASSQQTICL